jgi:hypothetical protein
MNGLANAGRPGGNICHLPIAVTIFRCPVGQCHSLPEGWAVAVGVMTAVMNGTGF